jgi:hypothetical protein
MGRHYPGHRGEPGARYDPLPVFAGATLGLWAIAAAVVTMGAGSLRLIPMSWIRRVTGTILPGFGACTIVTALTG